MHNEESTKIQLDIACKSLQQAIRNGYHNNDYHDKWIQLSRTSSTMRRLRNEQHSNGIR